MKTLNKDFYTSCSINYNDYIFESDEIIKIPNFFKSIENAREFLKNLNIWETSIYDNHSKPGSEGIMPPWTTRFLLERFFLKFDINCDYNSFFSCVNHFYKNVKVKKNITSSTLFPHVDGYLLIENGEKLLNYIVLINLNDEPITTNFWEFNNKNFVENKEECLEYDKFVSKYSKIDWNNKELEIPQELKIVKEITYNPNEAIVYPSNIFHSVKLEKSHEKDNARVSLRLSYIAKVKKLSLDRKYIKIDTITY
jgi:hypothetical protein